MDPNESTQDGTVETNSNTDNSSDVRITKCNVLQNERFVNLLISYKEILRIRACKFNHHLVYRDTIANVSKTRPIVLLGA